MPGERTGLFQRVQRPADGDPTQGGREWLLDPQIDRVGFQFFNGTDWVDEWDTILGRRQTASGRRAGELCPQGDAGGCVRSFVVTLPASDVDSLNPRIGGRLRRGSGFLLVQALVVVAGWWH
jgi:hypothetical protein